MSSYATGLTSRRALCRILVATVLLGVPLAVVGFGTAEAGASVPSYAASTVNSLADPSEVVISPDGSTAYVVDGTAVSEVDTSTDTVTGSDHRPELFRSGCIGRCS